MTRVTPVLAAPVLAFLGLLVPVSGTRAEEVTEVVVRGRLMPFRGDTAFSGVTLRQTDIEAAGSLDDALKTTAQASLFRRTSSLTANPTGQGLSLRAIAPSGAGRALVTLDGIPQNDPFGGWVIWAALPSDAIDHVRVVRGAGGGAYGAGALTGVVDLGLSPPKGRHVAGQVDIGESGSNGLSLTAEHDGLSLYYTQATRYGDAAVRDPQRGAADQGVYGKDRSLLTRYETALAAGILTLLAGQYESRRDTGLSGATAVSSGQQLAASLTRQPDGDRTGFRLQAWYRDSDLANRSVSVLSGRTGTALANDQIATPAKGYGVNAALRHDDAAREWEIGIDARLNRGEVREYFRYVSGLATRYRVAGGETQLIGLYAQGTQNFGPWRLTGAIRADHWQATDAFRQERDLTTGTSVFDLRPQDADRTVVSSRLGLTRQMDGRHQWRVAAYTGFRPPSLNELYRPFRVGNDVTEANSALTPETLKGIETGWRYDGGSLSLDAGLFHNVLSDPISNITLGFGPATFPTAGFIPVGGVLRQRQNAGDIRAIGLELSATWRPAPALTLDASATLTDAKMHGSDSTLTGKRPAQAPDYIASLGLTYRFRDTSGLGLDWVFTGESFEDDLNRQRLRPADKLRVRIDRPVTDRLMLRLTVDNALDADIPVQRTADDILSYDNRRSLWVSIRYRP
ncbi:TonB-dependent receptor [Asticcacaulis sp. BYS171W]|uniref:TonB-dependent receptor n=1 Tax=Asticcacaulis aquaticus TaxID=2984212 RepID=A0ABT5HTZ2_9CAUL|nr:TonB-dependent receptor [Asticcacaulis aquaticus]MDC7682941.1 TonB-dependent receptor [Asticcacaulis aquaticus]